MAGQLNHARRSEKRSNSMSSCAKSAGLLILRNGEGALLGQKHSATLVAVSSCDRSVFLDIR